MHRQIVRISKEQKNALLVAQDYSCAICGTEAESLQRQLSVDHNHQTNKIRGLLCTHCNVGLGYFKDNQELLAIAIEYLNHHDGT